MKKFRYYPQHTTTNCGPSCALMLLDYYDKITYPSRSQEMKIYEDFKVEGYMGMTGAAIANYLSAKKLDVHLIQSFENRMKNKGGLFSEEDHDCIQASHLKHLDECKHRIQFSPGTVFDCDFLKDQLQKGKMIILECIVPELPDGPPEVLHWVLLDFYEEAAQQFRIRDPNPRTKLLHLTAEELLPLMDTPIGRICILVEEKEKSHEQ